MANIVSKIGEFKKPVLKTLSGTTTRFFEPNNTLSAYKTLEFPIDLFFIRMNHYQQKLPWAQKMLDLTYELSDLIKEGISFKNLVKQAEIGINKVNNANSYCDKRTILNPSKFSFTKDTRGGEYYGKYYNRWIQEGKPKNKFSVSANSQYKNALTCKITYLENSDGFLIEYGKGNISNFDLANKEYQKLINTKNPSLDKINESIATIHWLIAQESPYKKGNDAIANVITKAIYHSYNVKLSPIKPRHSFDFEAFYSDLDEFIKKYPKLFTTKPFFANRISKIV